MSPTRRSVLHMGGFALTGILAGCVANGDEPDGNETTTTDSGLGGPGNGSNGPMSGTRPAGTGGPGVMVFKTDDQPDLPLRFAVEVTNDVATDDAPPQFEVSITNTSDEELTIGEGRAIFFMYVEDDDSHLILLPSGEAYPVEPGCWRLTDGIAVTEEFQTRTISAGDTITQQLDLYGQFGKDGCLPVGNFHFTTTASVLPDENKAYADAQQDEWGFTITME